MSDSLSPQKLKELKIFLDQVQAHPQLLHLKELNFFKQFLLHFGAKIPEDESKVVEEESIPMPSAKATPRETKEEKVEVEEPEEKIEDTGLLPPDNDPPLEVGDSSIEVTEEMMDNANVMKSEAMQAQRDGNLQGAVEKFTQAIKTNPRSGILYGTRAQALLDLKKPNAAIRDCDIAISKNPDSAKPYKVRAKAHRALGNYEQALKDIQLGQKLDWDESSHKLEAELKGFVDKIVANRKKREKKHQSQQSHQHHHHHDHDHDHHHDHDHDHDHHHDHDHDHDHHEHEADEDPFGGMPGMGGMPFGGMPGMPGMGGIPPDFMQKVMSDPEVLQLLQDPAIMEALSDPTKMAALQSDPRFAKLMAKFGGKQ